jgi:hypothetical protein
VNVPPTYIFKRPPSRLACRRHRRLLAGAYLGVGALLVASPLTPIGHLGADAPGSRWLALAAILFTAQIWVLSRLGHATRHIAEDPDSALDEMMVRLRNRAYRPAYVNLSAFAVGIIGLLSIGGWRNLSYAAGLSVFLAALVICPALPTIITAVTLPDVDAEA